MGFNKEIKYDTYSGTYDMKLLGASVKKWVLLDRVKNGEIKWDVHNTAFSKID
jgi:hypothetical protein